MLFGGRETGLDMLRLCFIARQIAVCFSEIAQNGGR
jgi:hypothetical protein